MSDAAITPRTRLALCMFAQQEKAGVRCSDLLPISFYLDVLNDANDETIALMLSDYE